MERRLFSYLKRQTRGITIAGALALSALALNPPAETNAQTQQPPESTSPSPFKDFKPPFLDNLHQLTVNNKQLPWPPLIRPMPEAIYTEPTDINQIILAGAKEMGIPPEKAFDRVDCESKFDPTAVNISSGARGLWQIMPDEDNIKLFEEYGWNYWRDWSNPYRNTIIATEIYKQKSDKAWDC